MHTCPECGLACVCVGDIDDIDVGESERCTCCPPDGEQDDEDEEDGEFGADNRRLKQLDPAEEDRRWNYELRTGC